MCVGVCACVFCVSWKVSVLTLFLPVTHCHGAAAGFLCRSLKQRGLEGCWVMWVASLFVQSAADEI